MTDMKDVQKGFRAVKYTKISSETASHILTSIKIKGKDEGNIKPSSSLTLEQISQEVCLQQKIKCKARINCHILPSPPFSPMLYSVCLGDLYFSI